MAWTLPSFRLSIVRIISPALDYRLEFALLYQFLLLGLTVLHTEGFFIPVITPLITLVGLSLVPGYLLLSALDVDEDIPLSILSFMTIVSSLVLLIISGVVVNLIHPFLISEPLSAIPLASGLVSLCGILYSLAKARGLSGLSVSFDIDSSEYPVVLSFVLLPFLGVFGAYLLDNFNENVLLLVLFTIIAVLPFVFLSKLPKQYYPIAIWSISVTVLLANTLSYNYLGSGIEYLDIAPVLRHGHWSLALNTNRVANLALMILYPTYALVSGTSLIWTFELAYPLLLSCVPVIMYWLFAKEFAEDVCLLSVLFFMYIHTYYNKLAINLRTGTAIIFLAAAFYFLLTDKLSTFQKRMLFMMAAFGVITSHYGTAHLFGFAIGSAIIIRILYAWVNRTDFTDQFEIRSELTLNVVLLIVVFLLIWDIYATRGRFAELTMVSFQFFQKLIGVDLYSQRTDAAVALFSDRTLAITVVRYLYMLSIGFITIGFLERVYGIFQSRRVNTELLGARLFFFGIMGLSVTPVFESYGIRRIYAIGVVVLAPLCVLGLHMLTDRLLAQISKPSGTEGLYVFCCYLTVFFLVSSGTASAATVHGSSTNEIIDKPYILENGDTNAQYALLHRELTDCEYHSSRWSISHAATGSTIYSTGRYQGQFALGLPPTTPQRGVPITIREGTPGWEDGDYIFVGEFSARSKEVIPDFGYNTEYSRQYHSTLPISTLDLKERPRIYDGGYCKIYQIDK